MTDHSVFIQAQLPLMPWKMLYKGGMISFMQNKNKKGSLQSAVKPLPVQENLLQLVLYRRNL